MSNTSPRAKKELVLVVLKTAEHPLTATEIWEKRPKQLDNSSASNIAALLCQLKNSGLADRQKNDDGVYEWFTTDSCSVKSKAIAQQPLKKAQPKKKVAAKKRTATTTKPDPIITAISELDKPLFDDAEIEASRLIALAESNLLSPSVAGWLKSLAGKLERLAERTPAQ
ncbi:MAG: hypothetical protein ABW146_08440 [Candidatus Sedimenticola sp. 6PFRAG7]